MPKPRATSLITLAVLVIALAGMLMLIGRGSPQHQDVNRERATRKWMHFVEEGAHKKGPAGLRRWPFSSIQDTRAMPMRLRSEAYSVLGRPKHLGLRFDDARHALGPHGTGLWVVLGPGVVCMFPAREVAAACRTDLQAIRHGILLQTYKTHGGESHKPVSFAVLGLAPDGVKQVRMKFGETWRVIPVHQNVYAAEARVPIEVAPVNPPTTDQISVHAGSVDP